MELGPLLERLPERIQEFCNKVKQNIPSERATTGTEDLRRHRRRQPETEERDSIIVHCLNREMDRFEICRVLDQKGLRTTPGLQAKGIHRWAEAWVNTGTRNTVQQIFSKALKK